MSVHWGGKGPGHVSRWPKAVGPVNTYSGATMLLDFLNPVLDPRITFSRGTGATRVNASGFIETVGNTTPRFDYDPVTLAPRGLLIEEARTNLLTYSDAFDNTTGWPTATNITITANVTASPDGTTNADRFDDGTAASVQHRLFRGFVTFTAAAHTYSVFVKAGTGAWFQLTVNDGTTSFYANFNATTGALGNRQASATSTITNVGNGWYRCTMTITPAAATGNVQIGMLDADTAAVLPTFTGANRTLFFYGAQLELGSFATSYIPTVASTVTRNADVATLTGTNFSSWYNQSEGTFVAQYAAGSASFNPGAPKTVLTAGIGADNNFSARIGYNTGPETAIASSNIAGVNQASFSRTVVVTSYNKVTMAYKTDDFGFSVNGSAVATDTSGSVYIPNSMSLGQSGNTYFLNGWIATIAYFNTRLPNAQLQTLTAPSLATTLSLDFTSGSYNVGF